MRARCALCETACCSSKGGSRGTCLKPRQTKGSRHRHAGAAWHETAASKRPQSRAAPLGGVHGGLMATPGVFSPRGHREPNPGQAIHAGGWILRGSRRGGGALSGKTTVGSDLGSKLLPAAGDSGVCRRIQIRVFGSPKRVLVARTAHRRSEKPGARTVPVGRVTGWHTRVVSGRVAGAPRHWHLGEDAPDRAAGPVPVSLSRFDR